jgi:uncharacterized membrane protein YciS (DUF1049 family)
MDYAVVVVAAVMVTVGEKVLLVVQMEYLMLLEQQELQTLVAVLVD